MELIHKAVFARPSNLNLGGRRFPLHTESARRSVENNNLKKGIRSSTIEACPAFRFPFRTCRTHIHGDVQSTASGRCELALPAATAPMRRSMSVRCCPKAGFTSRWTGFVNIGRLLRSNRCRWVPWRSIAHRTWWQDDSKLQVTLELLVIVSK